MPLGATQRYGPLGVEFEHPGGGISTELTTTVEHPLVPGRFINIPLLTPNQVDMENLLQGRAATPEQYQRAVAWAMDQQLNSPEYGSIDEAVQAAQKQSAMKGLGVGNDIAIDEQQVQNLGPDMLTALGMLMRMSDIPRQAVLQHALGGSYGDALGQVLDPSKIASGQQVMQKQLPELIEASPAAATALGTLLEFADPITALGAFAPSHVDPSKLDLWHGTTRPGGLPQPPGGMHVGTKEQAMERLASFGITPEMLEAGTPGGLYGTPGKLYPVRVDVGRMPKPVYDWATDEQAREALDLLKGNVDTLMYRNAVEGRNRMSAMVFDPERVTLRDPAEGPAMESLFGQARRFAEGLGERGATTSVPIEEAIAQDFRRRIAKELEPRSYKAWHPGKSADLVVGDKVLIPEQPQRGRQEGFLAARPQKFEIVDFSGENAILHDRVTGEKFMRRTNELELAIPHTPPRELHSLAEDIRKKEKAKAPTVEATAGEPQTFHQAYNKWLLNAPIDLYEKIAKLELEGKTAKSIMATLDPDKFSEVVKKIQKADLSSVSDNEKWIEHIKKNVTGIESQAIETNPGKWDTAYQQWWRNIYSEKDKAVAKKYAEQGVPPAAVMKQVDLGHYMDVMAGLGGVTQPSPFGKEYGNWLTILPDPKFKQAIDLHVDAKKSKEATMEIVDPEHYTYVMKKLGYLGSKTKAPSIAAPTQAEFVSWLAHLPYNDYQATKFLEEQGFTPSEIMRKITKRQAQSGAAGVGLMGPEDKLLAELDELSKMEIVEPGKKRGLAEFGGTARWDFADTYHKWMGKLDKATYAKVIKMEEDKYPIDIIMEMIDPEHYKYAIAALKEAWGTKPKPR